MKHHLLILLFFTLGIQASFSQKYIDQIRVGEPMPKEINKGGWTEKPDPDCSCRVFYISHGNSGYSTSGVQGETIGIHYENDTVIGVIKISMRMSRQDALQVYISRLSYFVKTLEHFPDRKLLAARDSNNGKVDGIYYFGYSYNDGKKWSVTGVVENTIIEETYLPNSNYKRKLVD